MDIILEKSDVAFVGTQLMAFIFKFINILAYKAFLK